MVTTAMNDFQAQMAEYFKSPNKHPPTVAETAAYYRARDRCGDLPGRRRTRDGLPPLQQLRMLEIAAENSDVLIPFRQHRSPQGKLGVREAKKLIEEFGVKGFKFHPTMQGFYPNARMAYSSTKPSTMAARSRCFIPAKTGVGSGMPGGMGMRLKYSNPMYMDGRGGGFPGPEDHPRASVLPLAGRALSVATHKPNVLYRPLRLVTEVLPADPGALHQLDPAGPDAVRLRMAGDHTRRWLADFAKLDIRDEISRRF